MVASSSQIPEGIYSLLDTDLYKLTMQCAVLKYFPQVEVTYGFTNRTPDMKLSRAAYKWLLEQMNKLENITITPDELDFLKRSCPYLNDAYLQYLRDFRLKPSQQIKIKFTPTQDTGSDGDVGTLEYAVAGLWVETILYEIPLLALTSEAYFKFCDTDWNHDGQEEKAYSKGVQLLENGCIFSEFGSRRRRDYHTHDLVMQGLCRAAKQEGFKGKFTGTSNVHFAMKYGVAPVGTVAHEWYMGIAAYTNDYENANELGLRYWLGCFGEGVLGIALTDTFGTPAFLEAFSKPIPDYTTPAKGVDATFPSSAATTVGTTPASLSNIHPPVEAPLSQEVDDASANKQPKLHKTYAQVFTGIRQDSGDPKNFVKLAREFYDKQGIKDKKVIVFSDSLKVGNCLEYKAISEEAGFQPTFGVGTFFTNDFTKLSTNTKSIPLNIVIKIASAEGRPAVKLSDNLGKNTGDKALVQEVKRRLGYVENDWEQGNEATRWGKKGD